MNFHQLKHWRRFEETDSVDDGKMFGKSGH